MRIALLTVSDTRGAAEDESGRLLRRLAVAGGHDIAAQIIVRDEKELIIARLRAWIADAGVDVIITNGGTGLTARDVTPEALHAVLDKDMPGFGEMFRMISYEKIKTSALQSRAMAGVAGGTYVFALPGSPGACRDAWEGILRHQLDGGTRPCNLVEIRDRLTTTR